MLKNSQSWNTECKEGQLEAEYVLRAARATGSLPRLMFDMVGLAQTERTQGFLTGYFTTIAEAALAPRIVFASCE